MAVVGCRNALTAPCNFMLTCADMNLVHPFCHCRNLRHFYAHCIIIQKWFRINRILSYQIFCLIALNFYYHCTANCEKVIFKLTHCSKSFYVAISSSMTFPFLSLLCFKVFRVPVWIKMTDLVWITKNSIFLWCKKLRSIEKVCVYYYIDMFDARLWNMQSNIGQFKIIFILFW